METMTKEMHEIAQKTKIETVSMKIITVVTLLFLPGTFISVSLSILYLKSHLTKQTLMSTPMVSFPTAKPGFSLKNIRIGALELFLALALPLLVGTFVGWRIVHNREQRKGKNSQSAPLDLEKGEKLKISPG